MNSVFTNCTFNEKPVKVGAVTNQSERQLKLIEKQLNEHIKSTKGKNAERVRLNNYNDDTSFDLANMNLFIDKEAQHKFTNKGWPSLSLSLKWKLVQEYVKENNLESALKTFKSQLTNGSLDVSYDRQKGKILSINGNDA